MTGFLSLGSGGVPWLFAFFAILAPWWPLDDSGSNGVKWQGTKHHRFRPAMIAAELATNPEATTPEVTTPEAPSPVLTATLKLCAALADNYARFNPNGVGKDYAPTFSVEEGRKYLKIVMSTSGNRSIHAFIDRVTGDVYKAANWKSPAQGIRYNLLEDPETCYRNANWAGGYLYRR